MFAAIEPRIERPALVLRLRPAIEMGDDQFFEFCQLNRDLRIERTAEGDIVIMSPTGGTTSAANADLTQQVVTWARRDGSGVAFDSSGGFCLPNGAMRAPDVAWVERARLVAIPAERKNKFLPLCPDFVIELLSPSENLGDAKAKMAEYLANGARLGWLIDPSDPSVYVYRPERPVERVQAPATLSGESVLPGFVLDLAPIWHPQF